jgi:hypothetical protein
MIGVIRSEWLKLRSVRSNLVLLGFVVVLGIGLGALLTGVVPDHARRGGDRGPLQSTFDRAGIALAGLNLAMLLAGVVGVHLVGQEYRFNTIRATFAAVPRRLNVMVSKFVVVIATIAVLGAVTTGVAYVLNAAILSGRGFPIDTSVPGFGRAILGTWLLMIGYSIVGFGVGMIVRQPIGGIILVLAFPLVVEPLLGLIGSNVSKWMPYNAGSQLLERFRDPDQFGPWAGFVYFVLIGVALCAIGAALANRRDA